MWEPSLSTFTEGNATQQRSGRPSQAIRDSPIQEDEDEGNESMEQSSEIHSQPPRLPTPSMTQPPRRERERSPSSISSTTRRTLAPRMPSPPAPSAEVTLPSLSF